MEIVIERDGEVGRHKFDEGRKLRIGEDIPYPLAKAVIMVGIGRLERSNKLFYPSTRLKKGDRT